MDVIAGVAWLLVPAFFVLRQVALRSRGVFAFDWYSLLLVSLFTSYVFPALAVLSGMTFPTHSYVLRHPGTAASALGGVLLLVFGIVCWVGYALARGRPMPPVEGIPFRRRFLIGLTFILAAATVAWVVGFGGFVSAITNVMMIRFGTVTSESSVPWFAGMTKAAWFAALIALDAVIRARAGLAKPGAASLGALLLGVSALALLLVGSRGAIGNVLLGMLLYVYGRRVLDEAVSGVPAPRKRLKPLLLMAAGAVLVVVTFKPMMTLIAVVATDYTLEEAIENFRADVQSGTDAGRGQFTVVGKVASEFSHFPILSTLAFEDDQRFPERRDYGRDLFIAVGKLAPASIYEPAGDPLSLRSTYLILGTWESQVPPGIIAWLLFTGGPLALLYGGLACGMLLAVAERFATAALSGVWWRESGYIALGITTAAGIVGGAPGDLVREVGTMVAVLVVALAVGMATQLLPVKRPATEIASA